jgi:hypothetical protein
VLYGSFWAIRSAWFALTDLTYDLASRNLNTVVCGDLYALSRNSVWLWSVLLACERLGAESAECYIVRHAGVHTLGIPSSVYRGSKDARSLCFFAGTVMGQQGEMSPVSRYQNAFVR